MLIKYNMQSTNNAFEKNKSLSKNFDIDTIQVSGPVNVVRLEGKIHGIQKVIYLFMDIHIPIDEQTECGNIYSKDVNKYFAEIFTQLNKSDKKYDFFMEIRPTEILRTNDNIYFRQKYINQVVKLFSMAFSYDKEKNKVNISNYFNNVRLHYLDIRDYMKFHILDAFDEAFYVSKNIYQDSYMDSSKIAHMMELLINGKKQLDATIDILENPADLIPKQKNPKIRSSYSKIIEPEMIADFSNKMRNIYDHDDIKTKMNKLFDKLIIDFKKFSEWIQSSTDRLTKHQNLIRDTRGKFTRDDEFEKKTNIIGLSPYKMRMIKVDFVNTCEKIYMDTIDIFADLTDIYFMRRFLDKDYITNAIVYSGYVHSDNYIRILLIDHGFKITHVAHSPINDIYPLEKEIKSRIQNGEHLTDLFYSVDETQCSDLTHFPKNFD